MTSTLYTGESLLKYPFVFDVDDAIYLNQRFSSVDHIAKRAKLIICGNEFLANYFSNFGQVKILPTAVDTERFIPNTLPKPSRIIGWSGSSSGLVALYGIEPALKVILNRYPNVCLKVISDSPPRFTRLPEKQILFQHWHPDTEVEAIQDLSIGVMPLPDREWAKGKCSYKMLTYMSVGVPVVASAVGMNIDVMKHGEAGFPARTLDEWVDALEFLLNNRHLANEMGKIGRNIVIKNYATNIIGPELAKILKDQY
jgi:glycosyltransferase involved in cell wall biosynthesis